MADRHPWDVCVSKRSLEARQYSTHLCIVNLCLTTAAKSGIDLVELRYNSLSNMTNFDRGAVLAEAFSFSVYQWIIYTVIGSFSQEICRGDMSA